ncbi:neutral/alkaline non-lysosomal ceramidase N-terminal domain-containing protein [Candidatus Bathyarchaeota archaeon]|nr:neutral/alkaline non-lysosomal ceramidase N-terminal domain-containing protein [Candidatus Bathyarchaeota archaeon]
MSKGQLQVGVASVNITPALGLEISGFSFGSSRGILDELYAKVLLLENENETIVIITTDLIGFDFDYVDRIREGIRNAIGVSKDHILLSASHTHSGPATYFLRKWGDIDEDYMNCLEKKLIGGTVWASQNLTQAEIGFGRGSIDNITNNRVERWKYQEDRSIDPEVGVIKIVNKKGIMRALLMNFSCHPTSLHSYGNLISADYPGFARRTIEKVKGDVCVAFTQGAGGDITPDPFDYLYHGTPENLKFVKRNGTILGCETLKIAEKIVTTSEVDLWAKTRNVQLPLGKLPDKEFLEKALQEGKDGLKRAASLKDEFLQPTSGRVAIMKNLQRYKTVKNAEARIEWAELALKELESGTQKKYISMEIQVIGINDLVLVCIPAEVFHEIGLTIKRKSKFQYTHIVSIANGMVGYIPTENAFKIEYPYETKMRRVYGVYPFSTDVEKVTIESALHLINST